MKRLLATLLRPPVPQVLGLLLLTAVIWFGGRALRSWLGLDDAVLGWIIVGVWVLALLVFVWRRQRAAKRARLIEDRLRGQAREHIEALRPDKRSQVEELEKNLQTALTTLKKSKLGKAALYELPWYVIIGPPGSGKTTLLRESTLTFPDQTHGRGVRGFGGTRNCDWWFSNEAILLDTAGRYTTQDEDLGEWLQFLDMLKKARPQKPINGAVVAISIADLIQASDEQLAEHARKVRERVAELTARLEVICPVYLVFSKCDLLDGFVETFSGFDKRQRSQLWGMTLPYPAGAAGSLTARFDEEFDALMLRLDGQRLDRLATTKNQHKKAKVFSFPMQVQKARARLRAFIEQVDQPNPYNESSDIRGCYLTSGTQEGAPLDQVLAGMRSACGLTLEEDSSADEAAVETKAYFIDDLFTDVLRGDRELARSSAKAEGRRRTLRRVGMIATGAAALLLAITLVVTYTNHAALIDRCQDVHGRVASFSPTNESQVGVELAGNGPVEDLRELFVELHDGYGALGNLIMGQHDELYLRTIRRRYVEILKEAFLRPAHTALQARLLAAWQKAQDPANKMSDLELGEVSNDRKAYRMLSGAQPVERSLLGDNVLKRAGMWQWPLAGSTEDPEGTARRHRETFLDHVALPEFSDWEIPIDDDADQKALNLIESRDIYVVEIKNAQREKGLEKEQSWGDILAAYPSASLLDDDVGVTLAYVEKASLDQELERAGADISADGARSILEENQRRARTEWKTALANLQPRGAVTLRSAWEQVAQLTEKPDFYQAIYERVATELQELGEECPIGESDWLEKALQRVRGLEEAVVKIADEPEFQRIVRRTREAQELADEFNTARQELSRLTRQLPAAIQPHMTRALVNLIASLQAALMQEIVHEGNERWRSGLGKKLGEFDDRFPFVADAAEHVVPDDFRAVFSDGGEFDKASVWIDEYAAILRTLDRGATTASRGADIDYRRRLARALFAADGSASACEISFILEKADKTRSVTLRVGDAETRANKQTPGGGMWDPTSSARLAVNKFEPGGGGLLDSEIAYDQAWGLLRLFARGAQNATGEADLTTAGADYFRISWSDFPHPERDNEVLGTSAGPVQVDLYYRATRDTGNPLRPNWFEHRFASRVFSDGEGSE